MDLQQEVHKTTGFTHLELLARQVVEGFISGLHKSPFHGYSAEFSEHKIYNKGESTKHIDWELYAKTDKLFSKRYEEETNLRCHFIIDNSASMHFPEVRQQRLESLNKIGFSVLAAACIMNIMKIQRDAVGLSVHSDSYEYYAPEKGSERHHQLLLHMLSGLVIPQKKSPGTNTFGFLHQIAEKLKRRSLVFLFSDMLQADVEEEKLFEALRHLKYNKHEVVLFHVVDRQKELAFDFDNAPKRFLDVETGEKIDLYAENIRDNYTRAVAAYFDSLKLCCAQYGIEYVAADMNENFNRILTTYLVEGQEFG